MFPAAAASTVAWVGLGDLHHAPVGGSWIYHDRLLEHPLGESRRVSRQQPVVLLGQRTLESCGGPLPLVVEVWSRSTGDYDVETKLREYQQRGHVEIWRLHPYERTLTAWRRQPDGSYAESLQVEGLVQPIAVPNVTIDLDTLFD